MSLAGIPGGYASADAAAIDEDRSGSTFRVSSTTGKLSVGSSAPGEMSAGTVLLMVSATLVLPGMYFHSKSNRLAMYSYQRACLLDNTGRFFR
jgi:hypothetical protein